MGGLNSIQFFWDFWILFNFAKPLSGQCIRNCAVFDGLLLTTVKITMCFRRGHYNFSL